MIRGGSLRGEGRGGCAHVNIAVAYLMVCVTNTFESYINYGSCDL